VGFIEGYTTGAYPGGGGGGGIGFRTSPEYHIKQNENNTHTHMHTYRTSHFTNFESESNERKTEWE
jgi:hypothetical protein